ncbi:MAG: response regulator [Spirochaetaceae bacterium]
MTILIADDSALIRSNLGKLIAYGGQDIILKNSFDVESTLRELDSNPVDVLILDIHFPDGSGLDVLRHVDTFSKRPFIMVLTNNASPGIRKQSLRMGADLFFDKTEEYERVVEEIIRLNNS